MKTVKIILVLLLVSIQICSAQHPSFLYKRKLADFPQEGWHNIELPDAMFARLDNHFNDVRIYSTTESDTLEIPYLLKIRNDQTIEETITLPILNKSRKNGDLYFSFDTKGETVNYLDLHFAQQNFNAFVKLEGSSNQLEWFEIVKDQRVLSIKTESIQYHTTQVQFPSSNYKFIRVSIRFDVALDLLQASFKNLIMKPGVMHTYAAAFITKLEPKYKQTIVDITLDDFVLINKLAIESSSDLDYYRSFTLEYLSDSSKTPKGWISFYSQLTSDYLTSINPNVFSFDSHIAKKLRLTINNYDNAPLKIKNISATGPQVSLISKLKPGNTFIFYGNRQVSAPDYDLKYFENKIPDSLTNIAVGEEEIIQQLSTSVTQPLFGSKPWLWGMMAIVIGVLAFFTLKMMKDK
jgi:hypothetical protein